MKRKKFVILFVSCVFALCLAITSVFMGNAGAGWFTAETRLSSSTPQDILLNDTEPVFTETKDCTTDPTDKFCVALLADEQEKTPYVTATSTNPVQIFSATSTPIVVAGFSFMLPQGWEGEVNSNDVGFSISMHKLGVQSAFFSLGCPPLGKGFEGSMTISHVTRSQVLGNTAYFLELEERAYEGKNHWYSLAIGVNPATAMHPSCWGRADVTPENTEAIKMFFETFDLIRN